MYKHKTIKTWSFKKHTPDKFCDKMNDVNFANYSEFDDVNNAFVDFSVKLMQAVGGIADVYVYYMYMYIISEQISSEILRVFKNSRSYLYPTVGIHFLYI